MNYTEKELLEKANQPSADALELHPFYRGKIEMVPKCCIRELNDFAIWYTPGVAAPCKDIHQNPERVFDHCAKGNLIAVVSDGSRVLGLGDIGPAAGLPVMEGKAILFKYLGGVDAVPLCINAHTTEEIVSFVKMIQPTFGGINLEDIANPKCFTILDTLREEAEIPVWHDDQQGTAAVTVAGLINALKIVNKPIEKVKIGMLGAGAANQRIAIMLAKAGANPDLIFMCNSKGVIYAGREDIKDPYLKAIAEMTNAEKRKGGPETAFEGVDVMLALSSPGPDTVKPAWIQSMAKDPIVFVCANPVPEIWPWEAKKAGARIVATGRSDFPNQVNNSLGFPGIFRGTLDVRASTITDEMCIAAARELAKVAEDNGLNEDKLIPTMNEWEVFPREAVAVGQMAIQQGIAQIKLTPEQAFETAERQIKRARSEMQMRQNEGFVKLP
ncbi:MAG: NADP-dependent malic enzyme [Deltaproteobacteria bacterium]|nr:NADP-dependent malic enzyme [Deltaproteobacteria bacterium]MBN2670525.1 NADP-dependent malic enzyme [Deltaproteobacteria bacterium]